jgi:hypothetical protein
VQERRTWGDSAQVNAKETLNGRWSVAAVAASEHSLPLFPQKETGELTPRFEKEGCFASETSHAGIIRIGFEGISQPHSVEHPCFNNEIETFRGGICKPGHIGKSLPIEQGRQRPIPFQVRRPPPLHQTPQEYSVKKKPTAPFNRPYICKENN